MSEVNDEKTPVAPQGQQTIPKAEGQEQSQPLFNDDDVESQKALEARKATMVEARSLGPEKGANVILSGEAERPYVEEGGVINIGMDITITMPSEAQQRAGFKVDNPSALTSQFPDFYKSFTPKEKAE